MALNVVVCPLSNSVAIYPEVPSFPGIVGQDNYVNTIQDWQARQPFQNKATFTDQIVIEAHTNDNSGIFPVVAPTLFLLDRYKQVIGAINLNAAPFYKGFQSAGNDIYTNPYDNSRLGLKQSLWSFSFNDIGITDEDTYYLRLINQNYFDPGNFANYLSEPISVRTTHEDTRLLQFTYNTNNYIKNVIVSGWWNDYPTNTSPFTPMFSQRIEGYIIPTAPKVYNIGYLQQLYQQLQIQNGQLQFWKFCPGEISIGITYAMLQFITEALLADVLYIDTYLYIVYNPNNSSQLTDLWKVTGEDANPLLWAEILLMTKYNTQQAFVSPPPDLSGRLHSDSFDNLHN